MDPVAFSARQQADFLLLSRAFEVKRRAIGPPVDLRVSQLHHIKTVCNRLPNIGIGIQIITRLINIGQLHRIPVFNRAVIGLFLPGQHFEQGRLARAIGTNHPNDATRWQ